MGRCLAGVRKLKMKVFDCFKFFNELELVHLRFMEYYDKVDYFVLVESTKSHTGKKKDLIFQENKMNYIEYLDKVVHIVVDDLPDYTLENIWVAENFQRNCIMRGLEPLAQPGDKIIVSDCDELWDVDTFEANKHRSEPITFMQYLFYYWVNCLQKQLWAGTCCATYGTFEYPQQLRNFARETCGNPVQPGGWHYSFMGGADKVRAKVENIAESHLIINQVGDVGEIQAKMDGILDLWNRTEDYAQKEIVPLSYAPHKLDEFLKIYPNFIHGE
jgi:beta-1,4-mannosyl-glycoprotein beta-1,4-N-acetylglucosaminyltransferase